MSHCQLQEEIAKQREQEAQRSEIFIKELQAKEQEEDEKRKLENQRLEEKDRQLALLISQQLNEVRIYLVVA